MKYFLLALLVVCLGVTKAFSQCDTSISSAQLNVNNINATIDNAGMLWTKLSHNKKPPYNDTAGYEAPKVLKGQTPISSLFTGGLWIGGIDGGKQLHTAASTYRQKGNDFSVGPYPLGALTNFNYDTVWVVYKSTIDSFKSGLFSTIPNSIKYWPGENNPNLPNLTPNMSLAPFVDVNNNSIYDPSGGDYPNIKGDEATWEVFTDACTPHGETAGLPLNIEVHLMAYAFKDTGCLNNTTFYQYDIINYNQAPLDSTYIGVFADPDLGWYNDDFIASIPALNMGVCYNGEAIDGPGLPNYGDIPPLLGVQMTNLPVNENGDTMHMTDFMFWVNDFFPPTGTPEKPIDYYHYMKAYWKDSTHITYGGNGHGGTTKADYMFPTNPPDTSANAWSECEAHDIPSDRRFIMGFGPFTFMPGAIESYTYDVLFYQDSLPGIYPCPSFSYLIDMANCVKAANVTGINTITTEKNTITFYPNPMGDAGTFAFKANTVKEIKLFNILGEQVRDYNTINGPTLQIQRGNLSSGIYFYSAIMKNGAAGNGKIIVQ